MSTEDGNPRKLSRRELLRSPFDHFKNTGKKSESQTTDRLVEGIGEAISVLGILAVAWKGSQDQIVTYEVGSESRVKDSPSSQKKEASLSQLKQITGPLAMQVGNLNETWKRTYEDIVCNPVTSTTINSEGEPEITTTIECEPEWNEPFQLVAAGFDRHKLWEWNNFLGNFGGKVNLLQSQAPESFDLSNDESSLIL